MPYSPEPLLKAIEDLRKFGRHKDKTISEEEMAEKLGIPLIDFRSYLNGEAEIPAGLPYRLRGLFGETIVNVTLTSIKGHRIDFPRKPLTDQEQQEQNRKSLEATLHFIKAMGKEIGLTISEDEIAEKAGLTMDTVNAYLNGDMLTPNTLTHDLHTANKETINAATNFQNRNALKRQIEHTRNHGLMAGLDITLEDMLPIIGLSAEELYAYLSGERTSTEYYHSGLFNAYPDFNKSGRMEIKEEIYLDANNRTVRLV